MVKLAVLYHPDAFTTKHKLMGRQVAGATFLQALIQYSQNKDLTLLADKQHVDESITLQKKLSNTHIRWSAPKDYAVLSQIGRLFVPGPGLFEHAKERRLVHSGAWSIVGVTHTLCSLGAMESVRSLVHWNIKPWDALICTSTAGKEVVTRLIEAEMEHIAERYGVLKASLPELPIIPLGVEQDVNLTLEQRQRAKRSARATLGVDPNAFVISFAGRLSFHAKAHPFPLFLSAQLLLDQPLNRPVAIVLYGQFPNDAVKLAFQSLAQEVCPRVQVLHVDGKSEEGKGISLIAADVFCSLSDNIQETFGITPIEAMAVGTPCVVTDWNGYRDTVREGIDGFRIRTQHPPSDASLELWKRYIHGVDNYDQYIGNLSMMTTVDIRVLTQRLITLATNDALRSTMSKNAMERVRTTYAWPVVISQYDELFTQLDQIRAGANNNQGKPIDGPMKYFKHYATEQLPKNIPIKLNQSQNLDILNNQTISYIARTLPDINKIDAVMKALECSPTVEDLAQEFAHIPEEHIWRMVALLIKFNIAGMESEA